MGYLPSHIGDGIGHIYSKSTAPYRVQQDSDPAMGNPLVTLCADLDHGRSRCARIIDTGWQICTLHERPRVDRSIANFARRDKDTQLVGNRNCRGRDHHAAPTMVLGGNNR